VDADHSTAASPPVTRYQTDLTDAEWRVLAVAGAAAIVFSLIGVGGITLKWEEARRAAEADANLRVEQAEQQRLAAAKAEQELQARAAAEAMHPFSNYSANIDVRAATKKRVCETFYQQ
jgi:hypothetical protein